MSLLDLLKQVKSTSYVADMLTITDVLEDDCTLVTKEGTVLQVIELDGRDYTGLDADKKGQLWAIRNNFFQNLPTKLKVTVHYLRKREAFTEQASQFDHKYAKKINEARYKDFTTSYRTLIYVVVSMSKPNITSKLGIPSFGYQSELQELNLRATELGEKVKSICAQLSEYKATVLKHHSHGSPLLSFWSYLINGGNDNKTKTEQYNGLNSTLSCTQISFSNSSVNPVIKDLKKEIDETGVTKDQKKELLDRISKVIKGFITSKNKPYVTFSDMGRERYAAMCFIKHYPSVIDYNLLDDLMSIEHKFNIVQHYKNLDQQSQISDINIKLDRRASISKSSNIITQEYAGILEDLTAEEYTLLDQSFCICVYGDTPKEVDEGIRKIESTLIKKSINITRETTLTEAAFWSAYPDCEEFLSPRKVRIPSISAASFTNFGTRQQGLNSCSFGNAPVCYFKTDSGTNFGLTFHPNKEKYTAGHTLVIGGTGSGKSVLMAFLMQSCQKFKGGKDEGELKTLVFDSLNGLKVPIKAFGGDYIDFGKDEVSLNPAKLPDTTENRRYLQTLLAMLGGIEQDIDREIIERMVLTNYENLDYEDQFIYNLRNSMGAPAYNNDKANFAQRMKKWLPNKDNPSVTDNAYGLFFNSKTDSLAFDKRIVGIDMADLLKDQELLAPLTSYIFHSFMEYIDKNPCPHLLIMDEVLNYIDNDKFYPFIKRALLEFRKRNGVYVAAVQDASFLYGNKNGEDFIGSFQTYMIFPNPSATEQHYMGDNTTKGLDLSRAEYNWIKNCKDGRQMMLKRKGGSSVILNVDLSSLGSLLTLLRGDKDVITRADKFQKLSKEELSNLGAEDWQDALCKAYEI